MKINRIEFQLSNQCNRQCKWCPAFEKKQPPYLLSYDTIIKTINVINENPYLFENEINITLDRYNEPLLYIDYLVKYINTLKNSIHNKKIIFSINTNGDYLNKDNLWILSYFEKVQINGYYEENKSQAIVKLIELFGENICKKIKFDDAKNMIYFDNINYIYNKSKIMNFRNRGGTLQLDCKMRISECNIKGKFLMIEHNGDVYPCCDTSIMMNSHKSMCCGNINIEHISEILKNINNIKTINNKICKYCTADICMFS